MKGSAGALLSVSLSAYYAQACVLRDVELEIRAGETVGLVGQSGSGKSTLALAILGLLGLKNGHAQGRIQFAERDLLQLSEREMRELRGKEIALVLQSPMTSMNPALRIRTQLKEAWRAHAHGTAADCDAAIAQAMNSVSLPANEEFLSRRPGQLSVGQAQRVLIAMAIIHHPALLIADEATSSLDVITQSEILALFGHLKHQTRMSMLYISHDLPSVAGICHRIAIMHEGRIVECAPTEQIFTNPQHPFTQRLISALPRPMAFTKAVAAGVGRS
jgi:ABC-type dipeptide/oligopeptide/nickel transport system ATPase component